MHATIGWGYDDQLQPARARAYAAHLATFIADLPYTAELLPAYLLVGFMCLVADKDVTAALHWASVLAHLGERHHDLHALAAVEMQGFGWISHMTGDLWGALPHYQRAHDLRIQSGNTTEASISLMLVGSTYLALGDLQRAEHHTSQAFALAESTDVAWTKGIVAEVQGIIALAHGAPATATRYLEGVALPSPDPGFALGAWTALLLGRAALAQGQRARAVRHFTAAIKQPDAILDADVRGTHILPNALSGLDEAGEHPDRVRALVAQRRAEVSHARAFSLVTTLSPQQPGQFLHLHRHEAFDASLSVAWTWHDPFGDCSYTVQEGVIVQAANGRGLWHVNVSAPRLLQPLPHGDVAVQTTCRLASAACPAIGGLLLWQDARNYLVLERGHWGASDIAFRGCLDNEDCFLGQGRLPAEQTCLRLERHGDQVRALCSADGQQWATAGAVAFPPREGQQIGLHAIGMIDRTIYHGAFPAGTAIRFERFEVWTAERV